MTLQQHFNLITEGKGNKAQFLKQARLLFPEYFNQYTDFNTATNVLKSKQIISEAAGGVVAKGYSVYDWKKILGEEIKATEKETSKEVADANKNAFQPSDMKNADNVNFNEIMKGFFAEMYDEKNKKKTGDEIKAMVVKNLAKDALYYTKNGNFSTMGVGYTTEAPGLGEPKAPKGRHKASGYGDIEKEVKVKANVQDSLGNKEAKDSMPKKVKEMSVTPQNSAGVKKMKMPGAEKKMKLQEGESKLRSVIRNLIKEELNSSTKYEIINSNVNEESLNNILDAIELVNSNGLDLKIIDNTGHYAGGYNHINSVYVNSSIPFSTLIRKFNDILESNNIYYIHIKEELNEGSIDINGKTVKTYTQNGDKSYNVMYDDGTKDVIMVSNDAWDKINTLHMNATNLK
jgi:hypothetical protein